MTVPKGEKDRIRAYADTQGQSVNGLICDLLRREMLGFEYQPEESGEEAPDGNL